MLGRNGGNGLEELCTAAFIVHIWFLKGLPEC